MDDNERAPAATAEGRQATRSILWTSWSQSTVAICGLVWLFTVPRELGAERYGVYILLSSLIDFHTMACTLGIHNAFAYYYPRYQAVGHTHHLAQLTGRYSSLVLGISLLGALVIGGAGRALGGAAVTSLMLACVAIAALLHAGNGILGGILYGQNRIAVYSGRYPLQQLFTVPLVLFGSRYYGLDGAMVALAGTSALIFIWLLFVVRPWRKEGDAVANPTPPRASAPGLRGPVMFGILAMFGSLAALTITRGGNIVLAGVGRSSVEVAVFAVGMAFVLQGTMLLSALGTALTPGLAGMLAAGEHERAHDWAQRAAKYQAIAALAAVACVVFLGDDLLKVAVGERFPNVFFVTELGVFALIPLAQINLTNQIGIAWGHPRVNLESWLLMSVSFVLAAGYAGAIRGPVGAAAALVAVSWLTALIMCRRLHALGGPNVLPTSVWKLLLIGVCGFSLAALHGGFLESLSLYTAFLIYLALTSLLLGVIGLGEIRDIANSLKRAT